MASRITFSSSRSLLRIALPTATPCFRSFASTSRANAAPTVDSASSTPPPPPSNLSPKISAIVDQISTLTLLEAADLVDALKTRLNIVDIAMPSGGASAAAPVAAVVEEVVVVKEKTVFNVNLTKIDAAQKAKAIREVKAIMPSMNLVEAKKFVESLPKVLKENATKEEAEKLKKALEAVGAEVTLD